MKNVATALLAASVSMFGTIGLAHASVINAAQFMDGVNNQTITGSDGRAFTATAGTVAQPNGGSGAVFTVSTVGSSTTAVGIRSGAGQNATEIGGNEQLTLSGGSTSTLNGFTVALLYATGNQSDVVNEQAVVTLDMAGIILRLTANGGTGGDNGATAILSGASGTVTTISPGNGTNLGIFQVSGLNLPFSSLAFTAGNSSQTSAAYSDYALVNVSYTGAPASVPEPASLILLGAGLLGVGLSRRRNRGS